MLTVIRGVPLWIFIAWLAVLIVATLFVRHGVKLVNSLFHY